MIEEQLTEDDLKRIITGEYGEREARDANWLERASKEILTLRERITEFEKERLIMTEELGNLCAIDGHNDVRNGLVVGRIQRYRYRDVSPVVLINRLIELLKRLTLPAKSKEAESEE
jgi:hypothetical protein